MRATAIKQRLSRGSALFLALLVTLFSIGPAAYAQTQKSGQGLEISPPTVEVSTDPGKQVTFNIRVSNVTKDPLVVTTTIDDFVAQGEDGQAKLLIDSHDPNPYSVKGWGPAPEKITLIKDEAKTIPIVLTVPKDASPGGHYGVARFTGVPPGLEGTGVGLSASIGTLMLVNVSGNAQTSAKFVEFSANVNGKKGTFFEKGPVGFIERIQNTGNVHFKPIGTVRVTDWRGKEVQVLSVNPTGGNVLPNSIRKFSQTMDSKKHLFGKYKADANVQYAGKNLHGVITFWVIPFKTIAIVVAALILLFIIIRTLLRWHTARAINRELYAKKGKKSSSSKKKK